MSAASIVTLVTMNTPSLIVRSRSFFRMCSRYSLTAMNIHKNARLTPSSQKQRARMMLNGSAERAERRALDPDRLAWMSQGQRLSNLIAANPGPAEMDACV